MKKFIKLAVCLLTVVGLCACSGSSTDKQETVVKNFFDYLKAGDIDKLSSVCTSDNSDLKDLTSIMTGLEAYQDVGTYGQTFVDKANDFIKNVFAEYITSYEIKSVEEDGENYTVVTQIKMRDYNNINVNSDTQTIISNYQKEHLSELQNIYLQQGQQAMMEKIYADLATQIFDSMTEKIKTAQENDVQLTFTLTADGDNYLISKIDMKNL